MNTHLRTADPYANMIPGSEAACYLLRREVSNVEIVATFTVPGEPVSKARARFTKGGSAYTPATTRAAEDKVGWYFRNAAKGFQADRTAAFGVVGLFFSATLQRRDVDNMLKLILDGLNGVAWADDMQVTEVSGRKTLVLEPDHARTEIAIYRLGEVERRESQCERCSRFFKTYRSQAGRRFCSRECHVANLREARAKNCEQCGKTYDGRPASKFCSMGCKRLARTKLFACAKCGVQFRRAVSVAGQVGVQFCSANCSAMKSQQEGVKSAKGVCADCGGPTSKRIYSRCRGCNALQRAGMVALTIREVTP